MNTIKSNKKVSTLCWQCKNAVPEMKNGKYISGCSWSIKFKPVKGWKATKDTIKGIPDGTSYKVTDCPKFIRG